MPKEISTETNPSLLATAVFSGRAACEIDDIHYAADEVRIFAHTTGLEKLCPTCGHGSTRIHSYYTRCPRDLPLGEYRVSLQLRVRRFRCLNPTCPKQTFGERLSTFLPTHAQRTMRLTTTLYQVGLALGGEAGARLLQHLRIPTSAATLLRLLRQHDEMPLITPKILGVDDFALRKGKTYGTLLLDLEQHRPIELLPDRSAATLSQWLQAHPGVEVIVRDRSSEYAHGATEGAPTALQVADRWHLLQNIRQMLERLLARLSGSLRALPVVTASLGEAARAVTERSVPFWRTHGEETSSQVSRQQRLAHYTAVQQMRSTGHKIQQIARLLSLAEGTVRKYFYAPTFPERAQQVPRTSLLDPYLPYLHQRHQAGCENAQQLWREIRNQGSPGTPKQVERWLQQRRTHPAPTTPNCYNLSHQQQSPLPTQPSSLGEFSLPSPKQLAWLLMQDKDQLTVNDMAMLHHICQHPEIQTVYPFVQQFVMMVRQHTDAHLDDWLTACTQTQVQNLKTFAVGLHQDYVAVRAALAMPWSNGQTEGQVNRLKFIKRQMYGRANFDLLRLRVLAA